MKKLIFSLLLLGSLPIAMLMAQQPAPGAQSRLLFDDDGGAVQVVPVGHPRRDTPETRAAAVRVAQAAAARGPIIAIAVGAPYVLREMPGGATCVAVYGDDPASLRAAARALAGLITPQGLLPVSLA